MLRRQQNSSTMTTAPEMAGRQRARPPELSNTITRSRHDHLAASVTPKMSKRDIKEKICTHIDERDAQNFTSLLVWLSFALRWVAGTLHVNAKQGASFGPIFFFQRFSAWSVYVGCGRFSDMYWPYLGFSHVLYGHYGPFAFVKFRRVQWGTITFRMTWSNYRKHLF